MQITRTLFAMAAVLAFATGSARAVSYGVTNTESFTDFESFSPGDSVNQYTNEAQRGQTWSTDDEWVGAPGSFDEEIIATGGGNQGWRLSDDVGSGGFSSEPWSPSVIAVGEPGSHLWNDRGPDHTSPLDPPNPNGSPQASAFSASFDFWSATGTTQPDLFMSISPGPRQSSFRQSWIGLNGDGTGGIDVTFYETVAGGAFLGHDVAIGLDPAVAHSIQIDIRFFDGLNLDGTGNDEVDVYVDGALALTGVSTWETYYRNTAAFAATPEIAIDALLFNLTGSGSGATDNGFVFDNVRLSAVPVPVPAAAWAGLALLGAFGGAAGIRRKLRRD